MSYKVIIKGGAHPKLVDYSCAACGTLMTDVFFHRASDVTATHPCECGGTADKIISQRHNHIHATHSGMYGKYHEGLGCVIEDYSHKKRVMRELGVMEGADPVKGSRNHWKPTPERPAADSGSHWVDHPGELKL